ncbi:amino acid ABC transporter ATP-binding protein [Loigolactobacillus zhaoyuanensis]|uniref:Amino acid ABC transporter ATP-binding protein n=1 Tax=Loigolactobacillus zhaoyuanensis TaxID=2486017 RepID=A0ABW8U9A2_9LACO|nr:amino acid ABC transporter ATP-binding protein [Loigolactobacillus zhaoyuanensis]
MIEIKHLAKTFSNHEIFSDINLTVNTGEILAIIGPSGSGKSTLLRCLNLLEQPDQGEVTIGDSHFTAPHISKKQAVKIRQESTMVFQQFNLFRQKTAWQNVAENLVTVKKIAKTAAKERALVELDKVGLSEYANFYPGQLSGGQKQRVAIARSLATDSKILLLDEPTSALDSELVGEVLTTLKSVVEEHPDYTVILVSHELEFVKEVATQVIFFEDGQIVESGQPKDVLSHPQETQTQRFLSRFTQQTIAQ